MEKKLRMVSEQDFDFVSHFLDLVLSNRKKANAEQSAKNNAVPVHEGGVDAATSKGR
nr:hypothetical protein [Treponema sp.]